VIAIRREVMEKIVKKYGKEIEKCKTLKDLVKLFKKIGKKEGLKILDLSAHQTPSSPLAPLAFLDLFPENSILGCTIETNRSYAVSLAPPVGERYIAMRDLKWPRKFIAVEPILDFDWVFLDWLKKIKPIMVSVGYNNYTKRFPEPDVEKTLTLIKELKKFTNVEIKTIRGGNSSGD